MAVDKEMEAVFKSSRAGVDPVSGNDVPIGSTPEEVRDDIPAQLSEGEYVIPADVVRYYGVKFFEDLRTEAKTGWMQMEQNGRVGGEPVAPTGMEMGQDELPFDISELETIEAAEGTYVAGFDEGGLAGLDIAGAFAGMPEAMASGTEQRMYKNPKNPSAPAIPLIFINGEPSGQASFYIQQGYVPASGEAETVETPVTTQPTAGSPKPVTVDDENQYAGDAKLAKIEESSKVDWNTASADDFSKTLGMLESSFDNKAASGLASMALGPIGGIAASIGIKSRERNMAYDMLDGIASQLESSNLAKETRDKLIEQRTRLEKIVSTGDDGKSDDGLLGKSAIFGGKSSMYEGLVDTGGTDGKPDGRVTFADTWLGDALGFDGSFGIDGPSLAESRAGARRKGGFSYDPTIANIPAGTQPPADTRTQDEKISDYTKDWQNATAAVNSASAADDPAAWTAAVKAQSEASKAATKAIQEKNNRTGFFGLSTKKDDE